MKIFNILLVIFAGFQITLVHAQTAQEETDYALYGESFEPNEDLEDNRTLVDGLTADKRNAVQMRGTIKEVCQAKGCWMKVVLDNDQEMMVKFKNYGFFVPTDVANSEVIVNGFAFVEEMSVEEQKHYAADGGASKSAIAAIKSPKRQLRFEADGVLIKKHD